MRSFATLLFLSLFSTPLFASETSAAVDFTDTIYGYIAILLFVTAYIFVILEEKLHLRKSKPVMITAGIIWVLVALAYNEAGDLHAAEQAVRHNILEFAELMLFLLAAMTYIATMEERRVFIALRAWLVSRGLSLKAIFWVTGLLAFFISPIADNLTTALIMAAVVIAVAQGHAKYIAVSCINIVVAANAGGAFSPFGDITTLMVWQRDVVQFSEFFAVFLPSLVNWIIPATIMSFAIPNAQPAATNQDEDVSIKNGGLIVVGLFVLTVFTAVSFHNFLHLPPMLGMMTGLGTLKVFGYFLKRREMATNDLEDGEIQMGERPDKDEPFDIFTLLQRAEWDTLMFFYGVILSVGGLGTLGYLVGLSSFMYVDLGPTTANILVGLLSAVIDNIPVMFAVLNMNPEMSLNQWLLVTLTAGVGGSLLSIGSAAGVALMGQARGYYTFLVHLKWSWAIALGYAASIATHLWINGY